MTAEPYRTIRQHAIHSRQYLENGLLALRNREAGKAGELLWGSVAQAVHAVAASKNQSVGTHRQLKNFAIQLARELDDETLQRDFVVAESLHNNFYAIQQEPQDIAIVVQTVQNLVARLLELLPRGSLRETPES